MKFFTFVGMFVVGATILIAVALLMAIPTYYLWNWLMPSILELRRITFFEAWGINALTSILFKTTTSSSK